MVEGFGVTPKPAATSRSGDAPDGRATPDGVPADKNRSGLHRAAPMSYMTCRTRCLETIADRRIS